MNDVNIYYCETGYHLFLAIGNLNPQKKNVLILDLRRDKNKHFYNSNLELLNQYFFRVIGIRTMNNDSDMRITRFMMIFFITFKSLLINLFLVIKIYKFRGNSNDLCFFTLNRQERILFNVLKSKFRIKLFEDGLASYHDIKYVLGRDFNSQVKNYRIKEVTIQMIRKFFSYQINPIYINEFKVNFPDLLADNIKSQFESKVSKVQLNFNQLKEFYDYMLKDKSLIIRNYDKIFFSNYLNENDLHFYSNYFLPLGFYFKSHPSKIKSAELNLSINIIDWEFYLLGLSGEITLVSHSSTALITPLLFKNTNIKSVFLANMSNSTNSLEIKTIYRFMREFPRNIFAPQTVDQLNISLNK